MFYTENKEANLISCSFLSIMCERFAYRTKPGGNVLTRRSLSMLLSKLIQHVLWANIQSYFNSNLQNVTSITNRVCVKFSGLEYFFLTQHTMFCCNFHLLSQFCILLGFQESSRKCMARVFKSNFGKIIVYSKGVLIILSKLNLILSLMLLWCNFVPPIPPILLQIMNGP